ncbi:DUF3857 domain-containing protein [Snuella sedimenti]|uniref:DUF3857 and transglutaminase domain-containing protein n=1 Tax=Snuella sedimenti TaxID=2798802 RepID=A0A8J7J919_9FLAO|nr:DUF3857 domain-containing protein [Snuella sedimenti]MBJ6366574.1 DUF3857 and transglutaminase domain-containing protein [Snuella sedimenti]
MKQIVFLTVLLFSLTTVAQNYDFGKVSKEELEEKLHPLDSSANAAYLYKNRKTFFEYTESEGFQLITEVQERIKIYTQEGFQYATKSIGLYKNNSNIEKVTGIKAYTYNLVDGDIEETKLNKDGIFKEERSKYWDETKFTMPNIKEGTVIEYKYRITSPFYSNVDEFVFQHDIPVKKIEAKFEAPEYFNFKANAKGYLAVRPNNETKRDKITFKNKTRTGGNGIYDGPARTSYQTSDLEYTKHISSYNLENVPALKEEPYVNNINNYRSSVKYELSYTKFPNSPIKYYSTTWEDVVKTIYESPNFGTELNKSGYYKDDIDALIGDVSDPMKRTALIYNFVKSRVKWNGYYSKYCNEGVRKAYKEQIGNVAEINLMLTSMLRHAGLNANPVLVSTRKNGVPLFPTREGYNYVISCVEILNGVILLDATSEYGTPNILPYRTLNWEGRIIRKQGSSALISLYPKDISKQTISMLANLDENGTIEGACRSVKTSHNALSYREKYNKVNEEDFLEKLENKYNGLEVSDFKVANAVDLGKPVMESYKFTKESQADIVGDKIYFSPLFFLRTKENPFKLEKREFPIDFGYPSGSKYMVNIKLPEGYKVESVPESGALALPDDLGSFKYVISTTESNVQLIIETAINQSIIPSMYYETLKEYFKQLIEKENEQIVLTKV